MKRKQKEPSRGSSLPLPSSSDLRGRQSVRATFKLSGKAIDALSIVSIHLGIKQKSLFDHLIEDADALNQIARRIQSTPFDLPDRVQKTYVLSRRTLSCLDRISRDSETPRDALVEYSIQRLLPLIGQEQEKHQKRKEVLGDLARYVTEGKRILDRARKLLGKDDPVCARVEDAVGALSSTHGHIESFVERGRIIEDF